MSTQPEKTKPKKIKFRKLITFILAIAGTSAFGQFIIEESIQNMGFGVSMLIMNKLYRNSIDKAQYTLNTVEDYQAFHNSCQAIMYALYVGNPITAIWFQKYMESDQKKLDQYKKLVKEELFYLQTKQEKLLKTSDARYLRYKDKEHIDKILTIKYK